MKCQWKMHKKCNMKQIKWLHRLQKTLKIYKNNTKIEVMKFYSVTWNLRNSYFNKYIDSGI